VSSARDDRDRLIIGNISGFWGDRLSAASEVVRGGPVDVITGDYLAELTLAILQKQRARNPEGGFVPTFLEQMEQVLGECVARGIRVVSNAGGLNPRALAAALSELAARLGIRVRVGVVEGDDLTGRLDELVAAGEPLAHLDRGEPLGARRGRVVSANAYLGAAGIRAALDGGAQIVVTGRVADAALVVGPAAAHFGWSFDDWDRLAGAVAAGHILECSTQATGGNYPFLGEVAAGWDRPMGFPLAELHQDGSAVITKHPGTGGVVSVGTVTAQLLYEIDSPAYLTPDVTAHFDRLRLWQEGPDRVRVDGASGAPPPATAKVAMNLAGDFRNSVTVVLAGLDLEAKAGLVERQLFASLGGREQFARSEVTLVQRPAAEPRSNVEALAQLRIAVTSPEHERVGRRFSSAVVELMLCSVPGITVTAPPGDATPTLQYWPTLIAARHLEHRVSLEGQPLTTVPAALPGAIALPPVPAAMTEAGAMAAPRPLPDGPTVRAPLGRLFGARSGDKGGNANLGVWARDDAAHAFLRAFLTPARLAELLPDLAAFAVERYELDNLRAVNFVIRGLLGDGVASSLRVDPQAKTLAEYFRAVVTDLPALLLER
jgi:hypothetical protein